MIFCRRGSGRLSKTEWATGTENGRYVNFQRALIPAYRPERLAIPSFFRSFWQKMHTPVACIGRSELTRGKSQFLGLRRRQ